MMKKTIAVGESDTFCITLSRETYNDYQVRIWMKFAPEADSIMHFDCISDASRRFLKICSANNIDHKRMEA